jgi:ligand-binding sensor domain-containing protein/signal transduction histidine kinase/uncharacterized membrane-anchored protein YhcB (DUF1043 family)
VNDFTAMIYAQNFDINFERISIEQGLSQSSVFVILQDNRGFLWFGTQDGLNKYDGYDFKVYKHNPLDSTSLADDWINDICEDENGNIWVATSGGGLCKFDGKKDVFITYKHDKNSANCLSDNHVLSVMCDQNGMIWTGTNTAGLNSLDVKSNQFTHFKNNPDIENSISSNSITVLYEDRNGILWIGTATAGLCRKYLNEANEFEFNVYLHNPAEQTSISDNSIKSIFEDSAGYLWVGTENGLNRLDTKTGRFTRYQHDPEDPYTISNNKIYSIFEDKYHILWIATDAGLNFFNTSNQRFWQIRHSASKLNSLSNDLVRCIYQDRSGTIWIGTYGGGLNHFDWRKRTFGHYNSIAGDANSINDNNVWSILIDQSDYLWIGTNKGLNRFSPKGHKLTVYRHDPNDPSSLSDDIVRIIYQDRSGTLWFGTKDGGLNEYIPEKGKFRRYMHDPGDSSSLSNNTIRTIYEDRSGTLWIGTWGGLNKFDRKLRKFKYYQYDKEEPYSISDNRVRCIHQDQAGVLWIGTYGGLNKFYPDEEVFIPFVYRAEDENSISHERVLAIHEDKSGVLWIGTYGGGLNRFDTKREIFQHFTEEDGLANDAIYGILGDEDDNLWISTNKGISKFNTNTNSFKNYDVNDGLQSNEFNGGAFFKTASGEMFFGGINGYNRFYPNEIKDNKFIPPIVLTSFKIFGKDVQLQQTIEFIQDIKLSYKQNFFSFEFAALDYTNPEKNQYAYMLEGIDPEWIYCGPRRYANYTNLDGGSYNFKVKGTNSDGMWNEAGTNVKIYITPPYWSYWWFRIATATLIIGVVFGFFRTRVKRMEKQKRKLEEQVNERTEKIKETNQDLLIAKSETDNILNNVEEGLFLLDSQFCIKSQHSAALRRIFAEQEIKHKNFVELLRERISKNNFEMVRQYLELMFDNQVSEETLKGLNPLSEIELNHMRDDEIWSESIYLSFKFKRIYSNDNGTIELIVTVNDLTNQIKLTKKLEESEAYSKKQMDRLLSILHVEPQLLREFMESVTLEFKYIDGVLEQGEKENDYNKTLERIFRAIHMVKGNASLLDLKFFVEKAHEFEENISHIKAKKKKSGSDFIPLILQLNEMRNILGEINKLVERIDNIRSHFRPKRSYEGKVFITSLQNLIKNLANDMNKKVNFIYEAFDVGLVPYEYRLATREILIQLVRNSVYHGIETPKERKHQQKDENGYIEITTLSDNQCFGFRLRDDGRGLQIDKLRQKAKSLGLWSEQEIDNWSDEQVSEIIFTTGISTLDKANLVAGRGIGMDIVKEKINRLGGKIEMHSEPGKFCEFKVTLPFFKRAEKQLNTDEKVYATN